MGEIRVKVRLVNAVDESLAREGKLPKKKIRWAEAEAVVDTGAIQCTMPASVLRSEERRVGKECRL